MVSVIAPMVSLGHPSGPVGGATSLFLVRQVFAAALRINAPLDDLSTIHEATALGAADIHLMIVSLGGLQRARGVSLTVLSHQVVDSTGWWTTDGGVVPMMVVHVKPFVESAGPGSL